MREFHWAQNQMKRQSYMTLLLHNTLAYTMTSNLVASEVH